MLLTGTGCACPCPCPCGNAIAITPHVRKACLPGESTCRCASHALPSPEACQCARLVAFDEGCCLRANVGFLFSFGFSLSLHTNVAFALIRSLTELTLLRFAQHHTAVLANGTPWRGWRHCRPSERGRGRGLLSHKVTHAAGRKKVCCETLNRACAVCYIISRFPAATRTHARDRMTHMAGACGSVFPWPYLGPQPGQRVCAPRRPALTRAWVCVVTVCA